MVAFSHKLRDRITIMRPPVGKDAAGQRLVDFVPLRNAWAQVEVMGGLATIKAGAAMSKVQASIRLRRCADVAAGMRIVHHAFGGDVTYNVLAPLPSTSRIWTDIVCEVLK